MNIGKLFFVWLGVITSFALILIMLIFTSTPGLGYAPLLLIFDIATFIGWGVLVAYTIYALVLSGRAMRGGSANLNRKVIVIWLWCFLAVASVFLLAAIAGFTGQVMMIIAAILSVLGWGFFIVLCVRALLAARGGNSPPDKSISLIFFLFTLFCILSASLLTYGYFAACGPAWLSKLYHWYGVSGSVMGLAASFTFAKMSGHTRFMGRANRITLYSLAGGLPLLLWLILWIVLGDSVKGTYPAQSSSPYLLPYQAGVSSWVVQGNQSNMSHSKNSDKYAYDFRLSCGAAVLAARAGTVTSVIDTNDGSYATSSANKIIVRHSDGTTAHYLHIKKGSALVTDSPQQTVSQGEKLATVGNVGKSVTSHIHFEVKDSAGNRIPISFKDVKQHKGIPRSFRSYRSNNK